MQREQRRRRLVTVGETTDLPILWSKANDSRLLRDKIRYSMAAN